MPVAEKMADKFNCVMPTSTVYCSGQKYRGKKDEVQQIVRFLKKQGITEIELVVASSIGADLAMAFLTDAKIPVKYIFFDGGQFAQIGKMTRRIMAPFLYGNTVNVRYCLYDNGAKTDADDNSCEELVLEKVYPDGNYETELVDFYLVNTDTMQVTDEQKNTW